MDITHWEDPKTLEDAYDGIERRVLSYDDDLMLVHYTVEEGAVFPAHTHSETHQGVFVVAGEIELFGETEETLQQGDSFVVGPGVTHGIRGLAETSQVIDSFSPPIDEYR